MLSGGISRVSTTLNRRHGSTVDAATVAAGGIGEEVEEEPLSEEEAGEQANGSTSEANQDQEEWEDVYSDPLRIRFTQDKVHPFFYRRGPIVNVLPRIRHVWRDAENWDALESQDGSCDCITELVPPFDPIRCLRKGEEFWSLDNRRLYALQLAAMDRWPQRCRVHVLCRNRLPRYKFKSQYRKLNTTSEGRTVNISARYQQFDTWNWFDRAVELEWFRFAGHSGLILTFFEILPVGGALVFRTGLTGLESRKPLFIGFLIALAIDQLRQKLPVIERRLCEFQVLDVIEGESRTTHPFLCRAIKRIRTTFVGASDDENEISLGPMSTAQVATLSFSIVILALPYLLAVPPRRIASSCFSCWLGVLCVLVAQLASAMKALTAADRLAAIAALAGSKSGDPGSRGFRGIDQTEMPAHKTAQSLPNLTPKGRS